MLGRYASSVEKGLSQQQSNTIIPQPNRLAVLRQRLSFATQAQPSTAGRGSPPSGPPKIVHHQGPPKIIQHVEKGPPQVVPLEEPATPPQPAGRAKGPDTRPPVGTVLDIDCLTLSSSGKGVCKTEEGFVVFVPRALPGERLQVEIVKLDPSCGRGIKLKTLVASPASVEARCRHFSECGGCSHQELAYEAQLAQKQQRAIEALQRLGGVADSREYVLEPVGCAQPLGYRNKVTFTVSTQLESLLKARRHELGEQPTVGLYRHNNAAELVEIEECLLQDEAANRILTTIKKHLPELQSKARMVVQKVVIRQGEARGKEGQRQYMVVLHSVVKPAAQPKTREEQIEECLPMAEKVREAVPDLVSFFNCQAVLGREKAFPLLIPVFGQLTLNHKVNGINFVTAPNAFFQVNTRQAGLLVDMVYKAAGLRKGDVLVDLFCGVGLLGLSCAKRMQDAGTPLRFLYGYEVYNQAVSNARTNAKLLGLSKDSFKMKSADLSQPTLGVPIKGNVIICDPARAGLGDPVIDYLFRSKARTFVYVACDLATQARDLRQLCDPSNPRHFTLESVQICDMFPQTPHVECVAVMRRVVTWQEDRQKNAYVKMRREKRDQFVYDKSGMRW